MVKYPPINLDRIVGSYYEVIRELIDERKALKLSEPDNISVNVCFTNTMEGVVDIDGSIYMNLCNKIKKGANTASTKEMSEKVGDFLIL